MKYIKAIKEVKEIKKYWLMPTDQRFEDSLKKVGCDDQYDRKNFLNNSYLRRNKFVFIGMSHE